jgi:hypothetical protein
VNIPFVSKWWNRRLSTVTPPRYLFQFADDTGVRKLDPLATEAKLIDEMGADWISTLASLGDKPEPTATPEEKTVFASKAADTRKKMIASARKVFRLTPYDAATNAGVTDLQVVHTIGLFVAYLSTLQDDLTQEG